MSDFSIRGTISATTLNFQRETEGVLRRFGDLRTAHEKTAASSRVLERQTQDLNRALAEQSRTVTRLTMNYTALRSAMMGLALTTAITGFAGLASTVAALGGGIVMLTQQAVALGGVLGTVGVSAMGAMGQAAIVLKLALTGVGKALTTTGQDHQKALAKLTTPARAFVEQLDALQSQFREIKLVAQTGLFEGLVKGLHAALPFLTTFKQVIYDTATTLGYLGQLMGIFLGTHAKALQSFGERNIVTLRRLGEVVLNLGSAFLTVMNAASPLIGHVTSGIVTLSKELDNAASHASASGGLGHFFFTLRQTWDTWTATFGNVAGTLANIFTAAAGPAATMATAIKNITQKWQDWTGSSAGQAALTTFFKSSNTILGSMARLVGAIVTDLAGLANIGAGNAAGFFNFLRVSVLPILNQLLLVLSTKLFGNLLHLGTALASLAATAMPAVKVIVTGLGQLVEEMADVIEWTTKMVKLLPKGSQPWAVLAIGAGIAVVWSKLAASIKLVVLQLKIMLGLTKEMAGFGAAMQGIWLRGGKNQTAAGAAGGAAAGGSGMMMPFGAGGGGARRPGGTTLPVVQRPVRFSAQTTDRLLAEARDIEAQAGMQSMWLSRSTQRTSSYRAFQGIAPRASGMVGPQVVPMRTGQRTAAYRAATNIDLTGGKGNLTKFTESMGGATRAGLAKGAALARPVLAGAFTFAAINGIIGGITSQGHGIASKLQDVMHGATFGLTPSSQQTGDAHAKKLFPDFKKNLEMGKLDVGSSANLKAALDTIKKIPDLSDAGRLALSKLVQAWHDGVQKIGPDAAKIKGAVEAGFNFRVPVAQVETIKSTVNGAFADMAASGGLHMTSLKGHVDGNMSAITRILGTKSLGARTALALNFKLAAAAVQKSMDAGAISAKTGGALMVKYLIAALRQINPNWNDKQAGLYLKGNDPLTGKPIKSTGGSGSKPMPGAAQGMLTRLPGTPGPDSIPLNVNGRQIVAAPGEDVAIFTRHQRKVADQALAPMGGLPGLFNKVTTKHSFNTGGMVTGDTDYLPELGADLEKMANLKATRIFVQSGRRTMAEQAALVRQKGLFSSANPTGAAAPSPTAPHIRGVAADITPGRSVFGSVAGRFGMSFPLPSEAWHIQLIKSVGGAGAGHAGAMGSALGTAIQKAITAPQLPTVATKTAGLAGSMTNASLDKMRTAAQARVDAAVADVNAANAASSGSGGGGSGETSSSGGGPLPSGNLKAWLTTALNITGHYSPANLAAETRTVMGESGGNPKQHQVVVDVNSRAGHPAEGLAQVIPSTFAQYSMPGHKDIWNPIDNAIASIRYQFGKYGHLVGHAGYSGGGIVPAYGGMLMSGMQSTPSAGGVWPPDVVAKMAGTRAGQPPPIPGRGTPPPHIPPGQAITPGSSHPTKPKKKPKPKKPYAKIGAPPNLTGIHAHPHGRSTKKKWKSAYDRFSAAANFDLSTIIPDYDKLFENPLEHASNHLTTMAGQFDLSDEQPIVTLEDTSLGQDLTAFMNGHPDLAKIYKGEPPDKWSISSIDVVNTDGQTVQGKFVRGISQHVGELRDLLGVHTGDGGDATAQGGVVGMMNAYLASITGTGLPALTHERDETIQALMQLHHAWNLEHTIREGARKKIVKLSNGNMGWQDRIHENDLDINDLEDWLHKSSETTVGHRQTDHTKKAIAHAHSEIAKLHEDNKALRHDKPKAGDKKTAHSINRLIETRNNAALELDFLDGNRDEWVLDGGVAKDYKAKLDLLNGEMETEQGTVGTITDRRIPDEQLEIAGIGKDIGDWLGTAVALPDAPTTTATADDHLAEFNALLKDQLAEMQKQHTVDQSELMALTAFKPLADARTIGAFQHGGIIPETGLALMHKDELVLPDREGPFGKQTVSPAVSNDVALHLHGDMAALLGRIDARIDDRAARVTSRELGRRHRMLTIAPGR